MSFSLVDRISELTPGHCAKGLVRLPPGRPDFPPCLLVEAVGQLASHVTMQATDFSVRPVAASAGEVRVSADPVAGLPIELEVEIQSRRQAAIGYRGRARQGETTLLTLERAIGPLLPMTEFDDPERARAELTMLLGPGRPERRFASPADLRTPPRILERGIDRVLAEVRAPLASDLYAEHFPRRAVYPATLLLDAQIALALNLVGERAAAPPRLAVVRNVKVRSFTPPGGLLSIEIRCEPEHAGRTRVALTASAGEERVSSAVAELVVGDGASRSGA